MDEADPKRILTKVSAWVNLHARRTPRDASAALPPTSLSRSPDRSHAHASSEPAQIFSRPTPKSDAQGRKDKVKARGCYCYVIDMCETEAISSMNARP